MLLAAYGCASLIAPVQANVFLEKVVARQSTAPPILEELERVLGRQHRVATESRVQRLEEAIRPTFLSMPKCPEGGLAPDGVRYVLHRIFVDRHGWFVKGLDNAGEAWDSSSPAAMFKDHSGDAHDFFNDRFGNHTFNLHHTAVLAATLETFVHAETLDRLHAAYRLLDLSRHEDSGDEEETAKAIDTYLLLYVLGSNHSALTPYALGNLQANVNKVYPTWEATRTWARDVRREVLDSVDSPAVAFNTTVTVLEAVGDRYGRFQDQECRDLKSSLLKLETRDSGRVRLSTFYASALEGNWQFSETVDYLRQLGALDESDPSQLSVIIPNYINSPSNCVASSKFYSVCCIDECEALQGHLETHVAAPQASQARIVELVSALTSPTVQAPRNLPAQLVKRLDEIAEHHNGSVPLHSRLFAQWMHHAFPRECIYPHVSGTTKPLTPVQWMAQTGAEPAASAETMRWHVDTALQAKAKEDGEELPWSAEEELMISQPRALMAEVPVDSRSWTAMHGLAFTAAVCSVSFLVFRVFLKITDALPASTPEQQNLFV